MYISIDTIFILIFLFLGIPAVGLFGLKQYWARVANRSTKTWIRTTGNVDELFLSKPDGKTFTVVINGKKKTYNIAPIALADSFYPEGMPKWLQTKVQQGWWYEDDNAPILPYRDKSKDSKFEEKRKVLEDGTEIIEPDFADITPNDLVEIKNERYTEVAIAESNKWAEFKDNIQAAIKNTQTKWVVYMLLFVAVALSGAATYFGYMNLQYLIAMYGG